MPSTSLLKVQREEKLSHSDLVNLLAISDPQLQSELFNTAYQIKKRYLGTNVFLRGLVEISNICTKDCFYCGIRKSNLNTNRFLIPEEDIIHSLLWSFHAGYGSAVIQGGERNDQTFIDMIERVLKTIKIQTNGNLRITLSLGEQSFQTYQKWFNAGAHRYLLRIESSNENLFYKIHPKNSQHSFENRIKCLTYLQKIGFQVGTGVMIGLPFQSIEDLANDIIFFEKNNIDMIGMGPFIYHQKTPLNSFRKQWQIPNEDLLNLALRMIATTRIYLKNINIAATTALQTLHENGREQGLLAGANIIMPNTTETKYRSSYQLYENKPAINENAATSRNSLENKINKIGEKICLNQPGDSPHFLEKNYN